MKLTSLIGKSLVGVACMGFMLGTAAGGEKKFESNAKSKASKQQYRLSSAPVKPRVVFVEVTGSRIPQRVVLMGQQVNSGSPVYVVQGDELSRAGATSVVGMLSLDPSISSARRVP
jgi:hypothetical protein